MADPTKYPIGIQDFGEIPAHGVHRREVLRLFGEKMREAYSKWEEMVGENSLARGIALGKEEGIAIGEERGREEGRRLIARQLLADGMALDLVVRYTKLPLETVRELAETEEPDTPEPDERA